MPVINVYNEKEKCDTCGNSPVEFILLIDEKIERCCFQCYSKKKYAEPGNKNVNNL
jgi:hypothetical protein